MGSNIRDKYMELEKSVKEFQEFTQVDIIRINQAIEGKMRDFRREFSKKEKEAEEEAARIIVK